jgi:hypothetical protein
MTGAGSDDRSRGIGDRGASVDAAFLAVATRESWSVVEFLGDPVFRYRSERKRTTGRRVARSLGGCAAMAFSPLPCMAPSLLGADVLVERLTVGGVLASNPTDA